MRMKIFSLFVLAVALTPLSVWAQGAGARVVGGNGVEAFGGVFSIAPNPDLAMEGLGRDIGRDIAAHWTTYRWATPARSAAACEVRLDRLDHYGFYATMPEQTVEEDREAARLKKLAETPMEPWTKIVMARNAWGRLSLLELASTRNDGEEVLSMVSIYVEGAFTYQINFLCTGGSLSEQRALVAAIGARNLTQRQPAE